MSIGLALVTWWWCASIPLKGRSRRRRGSWTSLFEAGRWRKGRSCCLRDGGGGRGGRRQGGVRSVLVGRWRKGRSCCLRGVGMVVGVVGGMGG